MPLTKPCYIKCEKHPPQPYRAKGSANTEIIPTDCQQPSPLSADSREVTISQSITNLGIMFKYSIYLFNL